MIVMAKMSPGSHVCRVCRMIMLLGTMAHSLIRVCQVVKLSSNSISHMKNEPTSEGDEISKEEGRERNSTLKQSSVE